MTKTLIVIQGPTAVGKTAVAIALAKALNTEIVSADSRQVFSEMRIGTARPMEAEWEGIPHHLLGHKSIQEPYNAGVFETEALEIVQQLFLKHAYVIVAGGSGLYVQALLEGFDVLPEGNAALREALQVQWNVDPEVLLNELEEKDPQFYAQVDRQNPRRVIRALEVIRQSGQAYSTLRSGATKPRPWKVLKIGLDRPREELYARINNRMDLMLAQGLMEEALSLWAFREHQALQTVGYREIFLWKEGLISEADMHRLLKQNSRHYAKRQLTWLHRDAQIKWFTPEAIEDMLLWIQSNA
jgi:tRNA dimethylallyltransferase